MPTGNLPAPRIFCAILAAGQSVRFGDQDKLTAWVDGKMLGQHIAEKLATFPFAGRTVIASGTAHPCAKAWQEMGYGLAINSATASGQSSSVRLAADQARQSDADALIILLADMPYVRPAHIEKLIDIFKRKQSGHIIASQTRGHAMPPAIFPRGVFTKLSRLEGDTGARDLLKDAILVDAPPQEMRDINRPGDIIPR